MSDNDVVSDMNLAIYDDTPSSAELLDYLIRNSHRGSNLYGRIAVVADAKPGDLLPLGDAGSDILMSLAHISSAKALLKYADGTGAIAPLTDAALDLVINDLAGGGANAQCMGPAHKTAIIGLSQNRKSRLQVLGLSGISVTDVRDSRA